MGGSVMTMSDQTRSGSIESRVGVDHATVTLEQVDGGCEGLPVAVLGVGVTIKKRVHERAKGPVRARNGVLRQTNLYDYAEHKRARINTYGMLNAHVDLSAEEGYDGQIYHV